MKHECNSCKMKQVRNLPEETYRLIEAHLRLRSSESRISCPAARAIASELGVPSQEVGNTANSIGLKISRCQLGCF